MKTKFKLQERSDRTRSDYARFCTQERKTQREMKRGTLGGR